MFLSHKLKLSKNQGFRNLSHPQTFSLAVLREKNTSQLPIVSELRNWLSWLQRDPATTNICTKCRDHIRPVVCSIHSRWQMVKWYYLLHCSLAGLSFCFCIPNDTFVVPAYHQRSVPFNPATLKQKFLFCSPSNWINKEKWQVN